MTTYTRAHHSGTGPGERTPDGCSVDMWARLPEGGETEVIARAVPDGAADLLELGCGAGRMTRPLLRRGFRVTAVDESPGMLAALDGTGAVTVRSTIEDLDLGTRFDVVVLASFLVNSADPDTSARLLRTCARHVAPAGCVLVQRERDTLHEETPPGTETVRDGMTARLAEREELPGGVRRIRYEYAFEDARWSHTFYSRLLRKPEFEQKLREAGLRLDAYVSEDGSWARAVPGLAASAGG